jgi:hypothetical protein
VQERSEGFWGEGGLIWALMGRPHFSFSFSFSFSFFEVIMLTKILNALIFEIF